MRHNKLYWDVKGEPRKKKCPKVLESHKNVPLDIQIPNPLPRPGQLFVPFTKPIGDDVVHLLLLDGRFARRLGLVADAVLGRRHDAGEPLLQSALLDLVLEELVFGP